MRAFEASESSSSCLDFVAGDLCKVRRVNFGKISELSYFSELRDFSTWPVVTQIVGENLCENQHNFPSKRQYTCRPWGSV